MRCTRARRALYLRSDERLTFETGLALDEHLEVCDDCRALAEMLESVDEELARWPDPPSERLDVESSVSRIRERLDAADRDLAATAPTSAARRLRVVAGLAATIAAASALWFLAQRSEATRDADAPEVADGPREERTDVDAPRDLASGDGAAPAQDERAPRADRADADEHVAQATSASADADADEAEPIDPDRVLTARTTLREVFAALAPELAPDATRDEARAFAGEVDGALRAHGDWPWRRMTERLLADDDARVASAAARYLGATGDRLSANALAGALEDPGRAPAAAFALRDAEQWSHPAFAVALSDAERSDAALAALEPAPDDVRVRVLDAALRSGDASSPDVTRALVDALADSGAPSLRPLLEAAVRGQMERDALAARLAGEAWAPGALDDAARLATRGPADELTIALYANAFGARGVDHLVRCVERGVLADVAVRGLVDTGSPEAFAALVELNAAGQLGFDETDVALHDLTEEDPNAPAKLLRRLSSFAPSPATSTSTRSTLAWILSLETSSATPALRVLVADARYDLEWRRDAILAIGRLGGPDEADWLTGRLRTFDPRERRLAAAALVAIFRIGGEAAAERALLGAPERTINSLILELRRADRLDRDPSLHRISRALAPWLETHDASNESSSS